MDEKSKRAWEVLISKTRYIVGGEDDPRSVAAYLRYLMMLNEELRKRNMISSGTSASLTHATQESYSNLVDSLDEAKGLNNFGSLILDLASGCKNEGQSWRCSLKAENARKIIERRRRDSGGDVQGDCLGNVLEKRATEIPCHGFVTKRPTFTPAPCRPVTVVSDGRTMEHTLRSSRGQIDGGGQLSKENLPYIGRPKSTLFHEGQLKEKRNSFNEHGSNFSWRGKDIDTVIKPDFSNRGLSRVGVDHGICERTGSCDDRNNSEGIFRTAREQFVINQKKDGKTAGKESNQISANSYGTTKRSLGTRRGPNNRFNPPILKRDGEYGDARTNSRSNFSPGKMDKSDQNGDVDERLKNIEPKMIELIESEIMDHGPPIHWDDIAGLEFAKATIQEIVVWPMLRPDIFHGLRGPPKGLLLFGPPGTGKTLIGKCIASQSHATFFSISASSLTSKWVGEGEKMVRALFAVAQCHSPAVIFIDEIDSLLTQRVDGEHESSRRIKTEFLVQLDGATTKAEERFLVIGATNRPQELDEAARRRLVKRLYIPLPEPNARKQIVMNLMKEQRAVLSDENYGEIMDMTVGYSGADMSNVCREAALGPIRSIAAGDIRYITPDQVRPIEFRDFQEALKHVRPSVCDKDLDAYIEWNKKFGSGGGI